MINRMQALVGKLTISRRSDDMIYIQITDVSSKSKFIELQINTADFTMALTGLSQVECKLEVNRLDTVGKEKQIEIRKVVCPLSTYEKKELRDWLLNNCREEGWEIDAYLGSQGDVSRVDGGTMLRYSVYRYV